MTTEPGLFSRQFVPALDTSQPTQHNSLHHYVLRALDEIDYGVFVLDAGHHVLHANHLARVELARGNPLYADHHKLLARNPGQQSSLQHAITRATKGIRSLIHLEPADGPYPGSSIALVPLGHPAENFPAAVPVLAITCRPSVCEPLSLHFFAQSYGLTRSEEGILAALAQGQEIEDIVRAKGLTESTVRGYVKQLRAKTNSTSMRELLGKLSVLPPVVSSVKTM